MSGGVPKRVKISRTQRNTPSKAGRWGKPGVILCGGSRSRRAMCNSIKKRANNNKILTTTANDPCSSGLCFTTGSGTAFPDKLIRIDGTGYFFVDIDKGRLINLGGSLDREGEDINEIGVKLIGIFSVLATSENIEALTLVFERQSLDNFLNNTNVRNMACAVTPACQSDDRSLPGVVIKSTVTGEIIFNSADINFWRVLKAENAQIDKIDFDNVLPFPISYITFQRTLSESVPGREILRPNEQYSIQITPGSS